MDLKLFTLINSLAHKSPVLDKLMIISSRYSPIFFALVLCILYIIGFKNRKSKFKYTVASTLLLLLFNFLISYILGIVYYSPRPFVNHNVNLLIPHKATSSFPSSHSIGGMTIALGINNRVKPCGLVLILLSIIVGFSRIYVGNHYPSDVIFGFLITFVSNYVYINYIQDKLMRKMSELRRNMAV